LALAATRAASRRVVPGRTEWVGLHKPLGYVVSRRDPRGRPTVFDLVPPVPGLTYVGRLDVMTSGLLLLTTDGEAAHRLMHPRFAVERTYRAVVHGMRGADIRRALARPVVLEGRPVRLLRVRVEAAGGHASQLTLVLAEGRYRVVRRLCELLGLKVERLIRLSYGPIRLGTLKPGSAGDLAVFAVPDYRHLVYHYGVAHVAAVVRGGQPIGPAPGRSSPAPVGWRLPEAAD